MSIQTQLGAVIMHDKKPLAFYRRKLTPSQQNYDTAERELLSIIETCKEFRNILLGYEIHIHTDHSNLLHDKMESPRVHCWRLYLEEFAPTMHHIKGKDNYIADTLSHLPLEANDKQKESKIKRKVQTTTEKNNSKLILMLTHTQRYRQDPEKEKPTINGTGQR